MGNAIYSQTFGNSADYYETPSYSVLEEKDGYELRRYEASMWTSAQLEKPVDDDAAASGGGAATTSAPTNEKMNTQAFWSLFNYISGKSNEEKQKVSMTTPVVVVDRIEEKQGLKMSFFLPKENQAQPPQPSESHVITEPWPVAEFYVRKFSPPNSKILHYQTEKEELTRAMKRDGLELKDDFEWMRAGYDPPFKVANRRSEVWIPVDQVVDKEKPIPVDQVVDKEKPIPVDRE